MEDLVSVIIPTYKGSNHIKRAVESVLEQSYPQIEVLVVDDNQPDSEERNKTERILKDFSSNSRVLYIKHEKNMNGAAARNTGLKYAKGRYLAFLDDDDIFYSKRLESCVNALNGCPDCEVVYSNVDVFKNDTFEGCVIAKAEGFAWKELLLNESFLGSGSNMFFTRNVADSICDFDTRFARYQDIEYIFKFYSDR